MANDCRQEVNEFIIEDSMEEKMMVLNVPMEVPSPDKATMGDVVQYLNEIIEYHGPPCELCNHFSMVCEKSYRPRLYEMELGPYSDWHIRKFCQDFQAKEESADDENDIIRAKVGNLLDSFSQQYG
jgi:hypothetical protein